MKPNIYLDVDGVLMAHYNTPASHVDEFIGYVLKNHPESTYWLTTRCKGDTDMVLYQLKPYFNKKTYKLLEQIKPVVWDQAKTEGIDFTRPFLWFDDDLFLDEREALIKNGALDNYIKVDLLKNPNQLADFTRSFPIPVNLVK
jgi:hypothetical protein